MIGKMQKKARGKMLWRLSRIKRRVLLSLQTSTSLSDPSTKRTVIGGIARHVLKLRYFIATGVIGGSVAAKTWYEEWKSNLPDLSLPEWAKFDDNEAFKELSDRLSRMREGFGGLPGSESKIAAWVARFEEFRKDRFAPIFDVLGSSPLDSTNGGRLVGSKRSPQHESGDNEGRHAKEGFLLSLMPSFGTSRNDNGDIDNKSKGTEARIQKLQEEMLRTQSQYQRELERLEKENKILKQRLLITDQGAARRLKRLKRSLIDMYSEVLDLLNEYDSSYDTADNLPRVVVVGDQSAGKTSVLEMVAQARIFPRGSGEMMTRAPVKLYSYQVTLSEGPYHVAQFKDSSREFDLTKEVDLQQLRSEIEIRMRNSVKDGRTVSNDVIALTVKGDCLCSSIGCIFCFPNLFMFRDGILKPSQMTTRNMSLAVSECFWRMVRDSIESQTDAFRATRFNLETEWKNTFPRIRQLDRDELFDKARGEILDEIVNLSLIGAEEWEKILQNKLWSSVAGHVFDQILMPASAVDNAGSFNTLVDIRLKHWADKDLAHKSILVGKSFLTGWNTLRDVFSRQVNQDAATRKDHDVIFDPLKEAVIEEAVCSHNWDNKALDYLRVIQLNAMEDRAIPDKRSWDSACHFMGKVISLFKAASERLSEVKTQLSEARGPGWISRWFYWITPTVDNHFASAVQDELTLMLVNDPEHKQALTDEDVTVIRRNLETKGVMDVPTDMIRRQWKLMFKKHFLEKTVQVYSLFEFLNVLIKLLVSNICLLELRVGKMIDLTCNALRQQITNTEQRRLEKEIKDVLDDWSQEADRKKIYLTGRRVELAEELSANFLRGIVLAMPGSQLCGEIPWRLTFNKGGCIDFGHALLEAVDRAARFRPTNAPPAYAPPIGAYYSAPPDYYAPTDGGHNGFHPPMHSFPDRPDPNNVFMCEAPPPYSGIGPDRPPQPTEQLHIAGQTTGPSSYNCNSSLEGLRKRH
uniref:dynamin GTPase n=1 Tax=Heterorhabditis bacteriophora TaxID=37862 RepID=A0A1I7XDV7_HETBA